MRGVAASRDCSDGGDPFVDRGKGQKNPEGGREDEVIPKTGAAYNCGVAWPEAACMRNTRMIPVLNLKPDEELSADQIVRVATGELKVLTDGGEQIGISLRRKDRPLLHDAIALGYLKHSGKQTRLAEFFCWWCDAREIPCVSFEVENDCVGITGTDDSVGRDDPLVTMHFDVATAGRPFTKLGLMTVAEVLLGKLWDLALSPWKISAGVLQLSQARQILAEVYRVWDTTSEPRSASGSSGSEGLESSASHTVH